MTRLSTEQMLVLEQTLGVVAGEPVAIEIDYEKEIVNVSFPLTVCRVNCGMNSTRATFLDCVKAVYEFTA